MLLSAGCAESREAVDPVPLPADLWPRATAAAIGPMVAQRTASTRVDPHPVAIPPSRSAETVALPDSADYHPGVEREVEWLRQRIVAMGLEPARSLPFRRDCVGMMVPPQHKRVGGCPEEPEGVLLFDVPERVEGSRWTVLALEVGYNAKGRMATLYRVELELAGDVFRFVRRVPLVFFD